MTDSPEPQCIAFDGVKRIASGGLLQVVRKAKKLIDGGGHTAVLLFDPATSERIDVDFHGTAAEVSARVKRIGTEAGDSSGSAHGATHSPAGLAPPADVPRGPGRPKLGVLAREVTLLPRHWDWLNLQPGGASVALRKLVDEARRVNVGKDHVRQAQEAAYRFMSPVAGHLPGFEEATRALFASDSARFHTHVAAWPLDVREHASALAAQVFEPRW